MGHYDGKEFEKILQEAQANMMKGIPSLEIEDSAAETPAVTEQASTQNPEDSVSGTNKKLQTQNQTIIKHILDLMSRICCCCQGKNPPCQSRLTRHPRRGLKNSPNPLWRSQPNLWWRDLPGLSPDQHPWSA